MYGLLRLLDLLSLLCGMLIDGSSPFGISFVLLFIFFRVKASKGSHGGCTLGAGYYCREMDTRLGSI